jgi:porphobilinogen synthase
VEALHARPGFRREAIEEYRSMSMPSFPAYRPRRLRRSEPLRALVRETTVTPGDLILPLFAAPGERVRRPVASMAGVEQTSPDELLKDAEEALSLGIGGVLLFGLPAEKDEQGSGAYDERGIVQRTVRLLKRELPELVVITDVCLCEYTSHGHCGIVVDGDVDNDRTVPLLARTAVSHAEAGADVVAPSDMMDGRVGAIRAALDGAGLSGTAILSYAAKPPTAPPASATGAPRSSTPATWTRRCARCASTSPRAPTW